MPIVKKLLKIGGSRAVVLPAQWLDFYEQEGQVVELIHMEADDAIIIRVPKATKQTRAENGRPLSESPERVSDAVTPAIGETPPKKEEEG